MTVKELIESARLDLHKKCDYELMPMQIINESIDLLFELLWKRQSHLIRSQYEVAFTAGTNSMTFSGEGYAGFRGLREAPYVLNSTGELIRVLLPLQVNGRADMAGRTSQDPCYFELEGNDSLIVYPVPTADFTLQGEAYFRPATLTDMADEIPYNGYFDRALKQVLVQCKTLGLRYTEDPAFMAYIESAVNDIIPIMKRTKGNRRRVVDF